MATAKRTAPAEAPVPVKRPDVVMIAVSAGHIAVLTRDGEIYSLGGDHNGWGKWVKIPSLPGIEPPAVAEQEAGGEATGTEGE